MDLGTKQKITSKTNFNIGSLTKQFTAMAILQLAERKKLSLQDHLDKFFPELSKKIAEAVNVQQLLTHSSGIVDHYEYIDTKQIRHAHDADVLNGIKNIDSSYFTPGSNYRYSNTAFCLLALIIERLSGMPYATYEKKNNFQPLGMTNTTVWSENETISDIATGYEYEKSTGSFQRSGAEENIFFSTEGDGGIYTSIDDYLKWMGALQSGKIFSASSIKLARSPQFPINKEKHLSYGYGWFVDKGSVPSKIYHSGTNGGFRTYSFTIPDERYMIVVFSNRTGIDLEQLVSEINKILRPAL
jgi:CubicO group peptidase (beta-lactamase class C family)